MNILIVDDDESNRTALKRLIDQAGHVAVTAGSGEAGQRHLQSDHFDLVILDVRMPGMSGHDLLHWISTEGPTVPVIMVSAYGEVSDAVQAMKRGAADYLVKPVDPDELLIRVERQIENSRARAAATGVRDLGPSADEAPLGSSASMKQIESVITQIAPTPSTVLITGESGTGKEVVARRIHALSPLADEPFVPVNMGGVPETLLESELFGHERGAFTGAEKRRIGLFESAGRGSLFLDEIGEMPGATQVKLLRALQERRIRRLGSSSEVPVAARIIAATNRDLASAVADGLFREDLYYRLNVVHIEVPPLRERMDDVPALAGALLHRLTHRLSRSISGFSNDALDLIRGYHYPGNVRELENILERAVIFCEGDELTARDILIPGAASEVLPRPRTMRSIERDAIETALRRWDGNRTRAAEELGISRRSIITKIKDYGLE